MSQQEEPGSGSGSRAALGADLLLPGLACALTAYYLVSTTDLVWEAKATGVVIGLVLVALCVALFVRIALDRAAGRGTLAMGELLRNDEFNRQRLWLVVFTALYVVTIHWVGATVGLFFLLIASMRLLGVTRLRTLLLVAFSTAAFVHLTLITLLDGMLPRGWIVNTIASAIGGA